MQLPEEFSIMDEDGYDFLEMDNIQNSPDPSDNGFMLRYRFTSPDGLNRVTVYDIKVNLVDYNSEIGEETTEQYTLEIDSPNQTRRRITFGKYLHPDHNSNNYSDIDMYFAVIIRAGDEETKIEITEGQFEMYADHIRAQIESNAENNPYANNNSNETTAALDAMTYAVPVPAQASAPAVPAPVVPAPVVPAPVVPAPVVPAPVENNENNAPYEPINLPPPTPSHNSTRRRKRRNGTKRRRGATRQRL